MTRITSDLIKRETGEFDIEIAKWLSLPGRSIGKIEGLGSCICLLTLDLSHNNIGEIVGLEALAALQRLNLSHNSISRLGDCFSAPVAVQ
jgi:Leucine-rich repeat (LRR) protein